ncbi:MAG TPA: hypothetical protein VFM19_08660, partial [Candidatus Limnocylindria bacterium]|nr:hypothetical protein [Candidatus Limnocylindria bacterium]
FVQGLIKEVAYGTLARRDRRARHLAAARHFEQLGDEELAGVLAQHYVEAYRAQPEGEEGAAVAAQARVALRGAAARARALASPARALAYLELALEVTSEPADEFPLRREAASAAAHADRIETAIPHQQRAIELATALGDDTERRRCTAFLGRIMTEGFQERGRRLLTDALAEPGLTADDPGYVELAEALANMLMRQGEYLESVQLADRALPAAEAQGLARPTVELLITRASALASLDRSIESVATLTGLIALAERRGLSDSALRAAINLSYALEPDDPAAGYRISRDGAEKAVQRGQRWGLRYLVGNACEAAIQVGDWDWALEQVRGDAWAEAEPLERLWFGAIETRILAARGESVDERVAEYQQIAASYDDWQFLVVAASAAFDAMLAQGRHADLLQLARESLGWGGQGAVDAAPPVGCRAALRLHDADAIRELLAAFERARGGRRASAERAAMTGALAAVEGRRAEARAGFMESLRLNRELNLAWPLALTALDAVIADVLEPAERQRVADEARAIFERLGARPALRELDAALGAAPSAGSAGARERQAVPTADELRSV